MLETGPSQLTSHVCYRSIKLLIQIVTETLKPRSEKPPAVFPEKTGVQTLKPHTVVLAFVAFVSGAVFWSFFVLRIHKLFVTNRTKIL